MLKEITAAVREDDVLPQCSESTLYRSLRYLNFEILKRNCKSFLIE